MPDITQHTFEVWERPADPNHCKFYKLYMPGSSIYQDGRQGTVVDFIERAIGRRAYLVKVAQP